MTFVSCFAIDRLLCRCQLSIRKVHDYLYSQKCKVHFKNTKTKPVKMCVTNVQSLCEYVYILGNISWRRSSKSARIQLTYPLRVFGGDKRGTTTACRIIMAPDAPFSAKWVNSVPFCFLILHYCSYHFFSEACTLGIACTTTEFIKTGFDQRIISVIVRLYFFQWNNASFKQFICK